MPMLTVFSRLRKFWRRSLFLAGLTAMLPVLLCPEHIYAQTDETSRARNQPVKPYHVIGNIYYVGASDVTSFLITTPKGHILLDSGFFETVPQIKQNIAELGFRLTDVKILINSHAHYDHAGGLALLKQLTGATLMASGADAALLAAGGKGDFHFGDRLAYEPVKSDRILRDGDEVELGGVKMVAHLTPGHTKGCTTWTIKVKEGLKEYNVVFVGSTSVPGYKLVDNANYAQIFDDYYWTFQTLKSLPCDVFLGSHGSFFSMLEKSKLLAQGKRPNPFIDPGGYKRFIEETRRAFEDESKRQTCSQPDDERDALIRRGENGFTVRRVEFVGNTYTRDNVLRRRLKDLNEGDLFTRAALINSVRNLSRLRTEIYPVKLSDIVLRLNESEKAVDMTICLNPKRR
jgi:metallo-beta-lactamase class B